MGRFLPCIYAFFGCAAFCFIFELRRWRYILSASLCGLVCWLVYLLLEGEAPSVRYFWATVAVAMLAEVFARVFKTPATIFLIIGIIPLVPGGGIYYTMEAMLNGYVFQFTRNGAQTAVCAATIAVGCSLVSSAARILTLLRLRREQRRRLRVQDQRQDGRE